LFLNPHQVYKINPAPCSGEPGISLIGPWYLLKIHYDRGSQPVAIRSSVFICSMKAPGRISCIFWRNCILATSSGTHMLVSIQVALSILTNFVFFDLDLLAFIM